MTAKKKTAAKPANEVIVAIKGFDRNLQCRGYQFEIGKTYEHDGKVKACESGFHAVEYPLDVFSYYASADSRFCVVELSGEFSRHADDTKVAAGKISIKAEVGIPQLVTRAIEWITARCTPEGGAATGDQGAASATGEASVAMASGLYGCASASAGSAIFLVNRYDNGAIRHVFASKVGDNNIKPDVFYALGDDGVPVEATG